MGCIAGKTEDTCNGYEVQSKCTEQSGIDNSALEACVKDESLVKTLMVKNEKLSRKIISVPTLYLNGKAQASDPETKAELDKALCKAGAKAAC